jgi:hypothetical protein
LQAFDDTPRKRVVAIVGFVDDEGEVAAQVAERHIPRQLARQGLLDIEEALCQRRQSQVARQSAHQRLQTRNFGILLIGIESDVKVGYKTAQRRCDIRKAIPILDRVSAQLELEVAATGLLDDLF